MIFHYILKGNKIKMNTEIMIQKNTSIQFPAVINEDYNELMNFIQIQKEERAIVIVAEKTNLSAKLIELADVLRADYINPLSDTFVSDLADAVSSNKFIVWFASTDHETVLKLDAYSLKGIQYILVPVTPVAQITCEYIYDIWSDKPSEFYPLGIYNAVSVWTKAETDAYTEGLASVLRLGIQESGNFYEWFLGNMYEVYDKDQDFIIKMLEKKFGLFQTRIDKKTTAQRCVPHYGAMFESCIRKSCPEMHAADIISLACQMHSYLAWGKKILSMEEFYEMRDMFVAFDMSISETTAKAEIINKNLQNEKNKYFYTQFSEFPYLSKIGKIITGLKPGDNELLDAAKAVYFDEEEMN